MQLTEATRLEAERAGYTYLDQSEREFLAEILWQSTEPASHRLRLKPADRRLALELRERIRPSYSRPARPEDMGADDGLGA